MLFIKHQQPAFLGDDVNSNMDEEPQQPEKISVYNSGVAQIKRLDELWNKTHKYAEGGLLSKWNWILDRIWCELIGDLELSEEDSKDKSYKDTFDGFKVIIGDINQKFVKKEIKAEEYKRELYENLMDKEAFLRRLQQRLGKGTKFVDADEDMIE